MQNSSQLTITKKLPVFGTDGNAEPFFTIKFKKVQMEADDRGKLGEKGYIMYERTWPQFYPQSGFFHDSFQYYLAGGWIFISKSIRVAIKLKVMF